MMTKILVAGIATVVVATTALVGTGMYAANTAASTGATSKNMHMSSRMGQAMNPQDLATTLSGKVSPEALTALTTLMTKHKAEMDAAKSAGTPVDKTAMEAQRLAFKTEMEALLTKYPELKTAMPQGGGMMGKQMGRGNGEIETIMATLPATVQTEIKSIHDSYQTKQETLRTEEKSKIDAILAAYPEIKAKIDTLEANHPQGDREGRGGHDRSEQDKTTTSTTTAQ